MSSSQRMGSRIRQKGSRNERKVLKLLLSNSNKINEKLFSLCFTRRVSGPLKARIIGERSKRLRGKGVGPNHTSSKTDLLVEKGNKRITISLKSSLSGQVYLIRTERFIDGMKKIYNISMPLKAQKGLHKIIGKIKNKRLLEKLSPLEKRQKRLSLHSLRKLHPEEFLSLLEWFKQNLSKVFLFAFRDGMNDQKIHKADVLPYFNEGVYRAAS